MSNTKQFTHNQPLGNSNPTHTGFIPGESMKTASAMMPLIPDATSGKLIVWDDQHVGVACSVLAASAGQSSTELAFYKPCLLYASPSP